MPLGRRMLSRGGRQNGIMYVYMPAGLPEPFYAQTLFAVRLVDPVHDLSCRFCSSIPNPLSVCRIAWRREV